MSQENHLAKAADCILFDKCKLKRPVAEGNRKLVIGESLIDVVHSPDGSAQEHFDGSPANVAVGLTRLGNDVTFATMIGDDRRGTRIAQLLAEQGVKSTVRRTLRRPSWLRCVRSLCPCR